MASKGEDTADKAANRAQERSTAKAQADDFTTDTILLVGEFQRGKGGLLQRGIGGIGKGKAAVINVERNVTEAKRAGAGVGCCVFAGTEQEKEGKTDHVGNGKVARRSFGLGSSHDLAYDLNRNGLYSVGRRVCTRVAGKLAGQAEIHVALRVTPWVVGPQVSERLANAP